MIKVIVDFELCSKDAHDWGQIFWGEGRKSCDTGFTKLLGINMLVTLSHTYISILAGNYVWIGLNDIAEEGTFVWTDGSPNTYAKFTDGEPDNYLNSEDCVVISKISSGDYGDGPCGRGGSRGSQISHANNVKKGI